MYMFKNCEFKKNDSFFVYKKKKSIHTDTWFFFIFRTTFSISDGYSWRDIFCFSYFKYMLCHSNIFKVRKKLRILKFSRMQKHMFINI